MPDITAIRCARCGATNRVPLAKLEQGLKPVCGSCKQPLPPLAASPLTVTDATFASEVERSPLPVLVDAWAPWCGPCRMVSPALERIATDFAGCIKLVKVNVDEAPELSRRFAVQGIPTLLVMRDGEVVARQTGAAGEPALRTWLESALDPAATSHA